MREGAGVVDRLTGLPAGWIYVLVFALVFAEDAVFIGFLLPGETAAIVGGVTASTHHTNVFVMTGLVIVAAVTGDSVGYEVGRRYGVRVLEVRPLAKRRERVDRARAFLARHGGPAVLLARLVAFFRAMLPFLSGVAHMRYRVFLAFNAAGGVVWGIANVLLGYLAGVSYQRVAARFGEITAIVVAVIAVVTLIVVRIRRDRRLNQRQPPTS
jgi:membrane protein DedA with SNARE-associated domain